MGMTDVVNVWQRSVWVLASIWGCTFGAFMYLVFAGMPGESYHYMLFWDRSCVLFCCRCWMLFCDRCFVAGVGCHFVACVGCFL